jgi:hypothetical protein
MHASKHTPGPWQYHEKVDGRSNGYIRAGERHPGAVYAPAVAHVCRRTDSEMAANARLIAAAPELLHWCKELRGKLIDLMAEGDSIADARRVAAILKGSGDIISKAQGDVG